MRVYVPDVITESEADYLRANLPHTRLVTDRWNDPVLTKITDKIKENAPIDTDGSYFIIEIRGEGHPPHYDGCKEDLTPNHMAWCAYSASVLLTDPSTFEGGTFRFYDPDESRREGLHLSLTLYSSGAHNDPQLHSADPHTKGNRTILLMFFREATNGTG